MNLNNIYFIGDNNLFDDINYATIEECYNYCKDKKILSIDIETTKKYNKYGDLEGLSPYLSNIVMFQIGDGNKQFIIDHRIVKIDKLLPLLTNKEIKLVGHNLKFEYSHILHNYNIRINNLYDTQLAEQILYNGYDIEFNLKALNKKYLGKEVDKSTRLNFLNIGSRPFSKTEIVYGAEDILHPLQIREYQLKKLKEENLISCVDLEMKFLPVLGDIEYKGINFNKEIWLETYEKNLKQVIELKDKLDNYIIKNFSDTKFVDKQLSLFDTGINCAISWSSPKQTIAFFKYLNICPQEVSKTTKKLTYTVNAKVVKASLFNINKDISEEKRNFINIYIEYKELEQSCTTFGKDFLKHINPITNRIHSNYWQLKATGRISSTNPNLQNIPSNKNFRRAFDAPEGNKIVNADYSGQETVILANQSQEENIIYLINTGGDMHSFVTKALYPELKELTDDEIKTQHKDKRQIAKAAGFAINYGGNGFTIAKNLGISEEEGDNVYNAYFKAFPQLKTFFDKTIAESMSRGYIIIDTLTNRKFYFKDMDKLTELKETKQWKRYFKLKGKYERLCLNYIIQGAAGSVTKYAAVLFRNWILNNKLENKVFITNLIHDEINVECKGDIAEIVATNLELCMKKSGNLWCKTVPLDAEAVITEYWSH
jgi:DNA polymerase-1